MLSRLSTSLPVFLFHLQAASHLLARPPAQASPGQPQPFVFGYGGAGPAWNAAFPAFPFFRPGGTKSPSSPQRQESCHLLGETAGRRDAKEGDRRARTGRGGGAGPQPLKPPPPPLPPPVDERPFPSPSLGESASCLCSSAAVLPPAAAGYLSPARSPCPYVAAVASGWEADSGRRRGERTRELLPAAVAEEAKDAPVAMAAAAARGKMGPFARLPAFFQPRRARLSAGRGGWWWRRYDGLDRRGGLCMATVSSRSPLRSWLLAGPFLLPCLPKLGMGQLLT